MTLSLALSTCLASFLDGGISQVLSVAVKFLAVAAGVVVGWFVGAAIVRLLVRLAFHRDTPRTAQTLGRVGGAFLVGWLVYLIPLGLGGSGGFGWGGDGSGNGKGRDKGGLGHENTSDDQKESKADSKKDQEPQSASDLLVIHVLGGAAVKGDRFYEVKTDGKPVAMTEKGIQNYMVKHKKQISTVEILLDNESADETTLAVTGLVSLCKEYIDSVRVVKEK
jgi:hypothetical protein